MPPWAPKPGASSGPLIARSSAVDADRRSDDGAERAHRRLVAVERRSWARMRAGDGGVAADGVLDLRALRVGREGQHEDPAVVAARRPSKNGSSEPKPRNGLTVTASAHIGLSSSR